MTKVIFHTKTISTISGKPITSTATYNHAVGIADRSDHSVLFVHEEPPESIKNMFDEYEVLDARTPAGKVFEAIRQARRYSDSSSEWRYISSYHYVPSISGYLSDLYWVLDANENPRKIIMPRDSSALNYVVNPIFRKIANQSDLALQTFHPASPDKYGDRTRYVKNGAVIPDNIAGNPSRFDSEALKMVWSGTKDGTLLVVKALSLMDTPMPIDFYGSSRGEEALAEELGISEYVNVVGEVPYQSVLDELPNYSLGICTFPDRQDFYYAHPLKIGEYLSHGLIPVLSDFPGNRAMAKDAGVYTDPEPAKLASTLEGIRNMSNHMLRSMSEVSVRRSGEIDWKIERDWFAKHALS